MKAPTYAGRACKRGHTQRYRSNGSCVECTRYANRLNELTPELRERKRRQTNESNKRCYHKHKDRRRAYQRRHAGLPTPTRAEPAFCEVCCGVNARTGLHLDHDHLTGKFRGWLCVSCNRALGLAKDDPDLLRALAEYLERALCSDST
jgi:hypothetical protein